jgi:hypothetical protein
MRVERRQQIVGLDHAFHREKVRSVTVCWRCDAVISLQNEITRCTRGTHGLRVTVPSGEPARVSGTVMISSSPLAATGHHVGRRSGC